MKNEINDTYAENYIKRLKSAKTKKRKINLINKIYEDGFEDGVNDRSQDLKEIIINFVTCAGQSKRQEEVIKKIME